jgi:IMP and pyridine-specific 5'-nucleotidase
LSLLSYLSVPSVGKFFTPLPLKQAFIRINAQRSISTRRLVPPSFNDIRYILSYAQLQAIAPSLKLISFDGDMTLYQDGRNFEKGSVLGGLMVGLLGFGLTVAIVTAAGYGEDNLRYEERLHGLISDILESKELSDDQRSRFYVMV